MQQALSDVQALLRPSPPDGSAYELHEVLTKIEKHNVALKEANLALTDKLLVLDRLHAEKLDAKLKELEA